MNIEYLKNSIKRNEIFQKKNKKDKYISNKLLSIVENFIINNKLICYGGTAINNILPNEKQFYDYDVDIPDYDFFSPNALQHAKDLCNIYSKENVYHVEGKNAFFYGTYKVFVNFVPIADITQVHPDFYNYLLKHSVKVSEILYTPPSFLRMSLHQELARPLGDVSRWEKIYERMNLLNIYYPIKIRNKNIKNSSIIKLNGKDFNDSYNKILNFFILNGCVFCNLNIVSCLLNKYFDKKICDSKTSKDIFIVYSNNLESDIKTIKTLKIKNITINFIESKYKFISNYSSIYYKSKLIGYLFQTNSCLSFNEIKYNNSLLKIGNLDTLLNIYFSLILMDDILIDNHFIYQLCSRINKIIYNYDNFIKKYGKNNIPTILNRFNLPCYGNQDDYQHILQERNKKYKELKDKKSSQEYKKWFFKYVPTLKHVTNKTIKCKKTSKSSKCKKNRTKRAL